MDTQAIRERYELALQGLRRNLRLVHRFDRPVLVEGGVYAGIWLECGPHEGLLYGRFSSEVARANHEVFFHHQREDGYLPCWVRTGDVGSAQIQMVVPIAATALETADLLRDEAFLQRAYDACSRWDAWLVRHRDTRGTGLCEAFCEYDTGHDNSPRFQGLPKRCPDGDAARCPAEGGLPYLAPDLSAAMYGGRRALAAMAERLGRSGEAARWAEEAELLRGRILEHCYDPDDECFYDVDREGRFVRIRGDLLTRVFSEHVVDQGLFDRIYERHIRNPREFWTPWPLPSIAANEPGFQGSLRANSWGGPSQALTALRAPRWLAHYGRSEDLSLLMRRWVESILAAPRFMQQMDPFTGELNTNDSYSPAMLVFVEFVDRLGLRG